MDNISSQVLCRRYQLLRKLGQGASGVVWLARDLRPPRPLRAVKLLLRDTAPALDAYQRLLQEGKISLVHPNIVRVLDCFEDRGVVGLVMEYVEGPSLADRLAQGSLGVDEALRVIKGVLSGLDFAHRSGVIHRDIKPSNVLLEGGHTPRLCDFGIARRMGKKGLTQVGVAIGTLPYMSPEQFLPGDVDHRTDVYSAGILLYELLTRRTPFNADSAVALMKMHAESPPPDPRQWASGIPEPLVDVIQRALQKNPDHRHAACSDMLRKIDRIGAPPCPGVDIDLRTSAVSTRPGSGRPPRTEAVRRYVHPTGATESVKPGFSWPAAIFTGAWLWWHGLIDKALYWTCTMLIAGGVAWLWGAVVMWLALPALLAIYLLPAFFGSRWREERLRLLGYSCFD
jgi:serine/threonine protein kinase